MGSWSLGLLFVAAWIIGLVIAFPPAVTTPADTLTTYYRGHAGLAMVQVYVANGLTGILLLIFVAALHNAFRSADGESSTTSNILLMAGTVAASLSYLEALFVLVLGTLITVAQDATLIRTLLELNAEIDVLRTGSLEFEAELGDSLRFGRTGHIQWHAMPNRVRNHIDQLVGIERLAQHGGKCSELAARGCCFAALA